MNDTKLIILRGPSGSGKSTTSKILFENASRKVALIEQDYYRFIFKPAGGGSKPNSSAIHKMIKNDALIALSEGYDVILEGILGVKSYDKVIESLFEEHPENNFMYYFDIGLEETIRRHSTRTITRGSGFDQEDMKEWYPAATKPNHTLLRIIPESSSLDETVNKIMSETSL